MNTIQIQNQIQNVAKINFAVDAQVSLYNPHKATCMTQEIVDRNSTYYFSLMLLQQERVYIQSFLRVFKGCVGIIDGPQVAFRDMAKVENMLKKCRCFTEMYATWNQRLIPQIMHQLVAEVAPKIMIPIQAQALKIERGLIMHGLVRKVLRKKSGREWKKIKERIKRYADKLNIDLDITLRSENYAIFIERMGMQLEGRDIGYGLKAMMVLVDNEPQKLSNLAVAVCKVVMGESIDKLLIEEKAKPIGLITNHRDFATDFLKGLLDYGNNETMEKPAFVDKRPINPSVLNAIRSGDMSTLAHLNQLYIKTVTEIDVDELSKAEVVPQLLEAETGGAVANITEIRPIPGSGSTRLFKDVVTGGKVAYENQIFGHQELKSDVRFVFVGEASTEFDAFKSEEIKFNIYQLGNNIPWDYQLEDDWGKYRSVEKILILTFLLMLGLEEMSSSGSDCETVGQSDTEDFLNDCCINVPVTAGDNLSADNAVPEKTLNAAIQLYTGKDDGKLSSDYLSRKGYHVLKDKKSAPIYKYYHSLGYDDTDLVSPRSGGNHVMGLKLKSKEEIRAAGNNRRIASRKTRLSDADFVRFFYDLFEKLLAKYSRQFGKSIKEK